MSSKNDVAEFRERVVEALKSEGFVGTWTRNEKDASGWFLSVVQPPSNTLPRDEADKCIRAILDSVEDPSVSSAWTKRNISASMGK